MPVTRVAKIYSKWRAQEIAANDCRDDEIAAAMRKQQRIERRLAVARSETLTDLAMKLIALSAEGTCVIDGHLPALIDEAKEIIGWTPRPGSNQAKAEAPRIAA